VMGPYLSIFLGTLKGWLHSCTQRRMECDHWKLLWRIPN
jgi:hypothetical protein